jgi:hypothetical protein
MIGAFSISEKKCVSSLFFNIKIPYHVLQDIPLGTKIATIHVINHFVEKFYFHLSIGIIFEKKRKNNVSIKIFWQLFIEKLISGEKKI